jgi:hypothetical protein
MNRQRIPEASTNARESAYTRISSRMMFGSAATTTSDSPRRRFNIFAANVGAGFARRCASSTARCRGTSNQYRADQKRRGKNTE